MRTIQYGGQLVPGDFIAVSNGNHMDFGWYCGDGSGTLQYYSIYTPKYAYERYENWLNDPEKDRYHRSNNYEKGFNVKHLWKAYINAVHKTRIVKLPSPEEIFTEREDRETYEKSKEILITLNFIKQ